MGGTGKVVITMKGNWTPKFKGSLGMVKLTNSDNEISYSTLTDVGVSGHYIYHDANSLYPPPSILPSPSNFPSFGLPSP